MTSTEYTYTLIKDGERREVSPQYLWEQFGFIDMDPDCLNLEPGDKYQEDLDQFFTLEIARKESGDK